MRQAKTRRLLEVGRRLHVHLRKFFRLSDPKLVDNFPYCYLEYTNDAHCVRLKSQTLMLHLDTDTPHFLSDDNDECDGLYGLILMLGLPGDEVFFEVELFQATAEWRFSSENDFSGLSGDVFFEDDVRDRVRGFGRVQQIDGYALSGTVDLDVVFTAASRYRKWLSGELV